jgi:hypothetical protein
VGGGGHFGVSLLAIRADGERLGPLGMSGVRDKADIILYVEKRPLLAISGLAGCCQKYITFSFLTGSFDIGEMRPVPMSLNLHNFEFFI